MVNVFDYLIIANFFVECFDLQYASPATISRCGNVWVDPKDIGFQPYFERWIKLRSDSVKLAMDMRKEGGEELTLPVINVNHKHYTINISQLVLI